MNDTSFIVYMDNAATVRLKDKAYEAMDKYLKNLYANPGGAYAFGQEVKRDIATAREEISSTLNARPTELFFTSGGTESDNQAIRSLAELKGSGHIIVSSFEHHAVLNTCRYLERKGIRVSYVNPDPAGFIDPDAIFRLIGDDTILISVMTVNNELGTIQPVSEIGAAARKRGILFHTDAVAAYGHIPIDVETMNIDILSASAHKFGGPKGAGFLYVRENLKLPPLILGGSQERGRRAGTENVPGIMGMAAAAGEACACMEDNLKRRIELDSYFMERIGSGPFVINGPAGCCGREEGTKARLPGHFNLTIPGANAEELVVELGTEGICISTGAACTSRDDPVSHVLKAIGLKGRDLLSTVRISMNEENTEEEIDTLLKGLNQYIREKDL